MIVRVFRATVKPGKGEEFGRFFREKALPVVQACPGVERIEIGLPMEPTPDEFLMITWWKDLESLKGFAGESWHQARLLEEEKPMLARTSVHHYETEGAES